MLYKFKSKSTADLIMLEANGRRILEIIGKADSNKGILLAADMPNASAALQSAITLEEKALKVAMEEALQKAEPTPKTPEVSLRQRAAPFLEMLRRCEKAQEDIVWGV
jgi:hypothetical protein